ncbi:alpha-ribazole phosphatase [Dyadobacter jejuensis]|uniref:Alpha-ribazole phosphatase n=1 Tax=Dyadobacter jejuensis TaxID=1082580 RepID=A0A316ABN9_9BACT|nr:alpha-ribazole phosphatase [Dyadobacter jejuensis]PWJ55041.1 alpha-ribazole phosphatase [Dyadobacter jejuensis]
MEVYLIRHTKPLLTSGLIYGHLEVPLADSFSVEWPEIIPQLPPALDRIYSSPSLRCFRLAELLSNEFNAPCIPDERLRELHFGDWEGQTWDSVDQADLKLWMDDFVNERVPGGESMLDLQNRVMRFWEGLQHEADGRIAIVTHAGVIRLLLAMHRQVALEDSFSIKVEYGEVVRGSLRC